MNDVHLTVNAPYWELNPGGKIDDSRVGSRKLNVEVAQNRIAKPGHIAGRLLQQFSKVLNIMLAHKGRQVSALQGFRVGLPNNFSTEIEGITHG